MVKRVINENLENSKDEYNELPKLKMDFTSIIDYMVKGEWLLINKQNGSYLKKGDLEKKITNHNAFKASEYIYDNYKNRYEYIEINDENIFSILRVK